MYRFTVIIIFLITACTTNDTGKKVVDVEAVKRATILTCALAPTAAQIAEIYTDNKNVTKTEHAVALLCAGAAPLVTTTTTTVK